MKQLQKMFVWIRMLNKRLYKRPSFLILLLLIPCMTAAFTLFSQDETHLLRIAVYAKEPLPESMQITLQENTGLIGYTMFNTEKEAVSAVTDFGFDAAWIFEEDIVHASKRYIEKEEPIVKTIQREDTVFLRLSREKLYALIYPYISQALYHDFMEEKFPDAEKEILNSLYQNELVHDNLVDIRYSNSEESFSESNHLLSPLKGLLAIAVFLCAYSAMIHDKKDKENGLYARIPLGKRIFPTAANIFLAAVNASAVSLIAFAVSGLFTIWYLEIPLMLLYVGMCTAFCLLLGEVADHIRILGSMMPILIMMMLVICPIFININSLFQLRMLFPPYYYLSCFRSDRYFLLGLVYMFITSFLFYLLYMLKQKIPKFAQKS